MSIPRVFNQQTHDQQRRNAEAINRALKNIGGLSSSETLLSSDRDFNLASGKVYKINSIQVVGPRETGWAADTGTAKKTANATYTAATISNPPTQAEVQAIATALQNASRTIKSLKDALILHGLIGA